MLITLIEFSTQILVFSAEGALFILGGMRIFEGIYNDFYFAMCWITDLSTLLKPYTLLIISGAVRESFLDTYWRKITKNNVLRTLPSQIYST